MPKPADPTDGEALAKAKVLRSRLRAADREDAAFFQEQVFIHTAAEAELRTALPTERVDEILAYRKSYGVDESTGLLQRIFTFALQLFGPVNGMAQPLIARAFSGSSPQAKPGAPASSPARMHHFGDSKEEVVTFRFSRAIRDGVLVREGEIVFHGRDLPADARIDIWSEEVVRNPSDRSIDWEFVEGLEWRIDWGD